jgi:hypothetical protein
MTLPDQPRQSWQGLESPSRSDAFQRSLYGNRYQNKFYCSQLLRHLATEMLISDHECRRCELSINIRDLKTALFQKILNHDA